MDLQNQNNSALILNDLGTIYYSKCIFEKANQYFEKALQIDANYIEANYNLALTKIKLGTFDEATIFLNKTIELEKNEAWNAAAKRLRQRTEAYE
jgi:Tfp pilus assembly protein PilF